MRFFSSHKKIWLLCCFFPQVAMPVLTQGASVLILNVSPWWGQRRWQQRYWFEDSLLLHTTKPKSTLNNNKSINRWPTAWWNSISPLDKHENEIPEEEGSDVQDQRKWVRNTDNEMEAVADWGRRGRCCQFRIFEHREFQRALSSQWFCSTLEQSKLKWLIICNRCLSPFQGDI